MFLFLKFAINICFRTVIIRYYVQKYFYATENFRPFNHAQFNFEPLFLFFSFFVYISIVIYEMIPCFYWFKIEMCWYVLFYYIIEVVQ